MNETVWVSLGELIVTEDQTIPDFVSLSEFLYSQFCDDRSDIVSFPTYI
jgi:hypothetical protein